MRPPLHPTPGSPSSCWANHLTHRCISQPPKYCVKSFCDVSPEFIFNKFPLGLLSSRYFKLWWSTHILCGIIQSHWRQASKVLDIPFIRKMLGGQRRTETVRGNITNRCGLRTEQDMDVQRRVIKKAQNINACVYRAVRSVRRVEPGEPSHSFLLQSSDSPQVAPLHRSTHTLHCLTGTTLNFFVDCIFFALIGFSIYSIKL